MAATNKNIRDFFALGTGTMSNAQVLRLQEALGFKRNEDHSALTETEVVDYLFQECKNAVIYHEQAGVAATARAVVTF